MPAVARLLLALVTLGGGWYALFAAPGLRGGSALTAADVVATPGAAAAEDTEAHGGVGRPVDLDAAAVDALLVESREAFAAERWHDALEPTEQLVKRFPAQHVYLTRLAETYRHLGRPADEAATWEVFMDRSPLPAEACPFIGHAYRKLGKYDQALAAFERCYAADTRNAELVFFVGLGNEWMSRFDTAQEWYEKAIAMAPPHYDSEVGLARIELHRTRLPAALAKARAVLKQVPTHVDAALVAGLAEQRAGHRPQARGYLEKAVKLSANYFDVQLALGVLDYSESRYSDARGRFLIASRLDVTRREEVQPWLDRTANVKVVE
jgi:tetratricopeptide (TPR) repeat protein